MYIAIEGIKGVGKSTIVSHLDSILASALPLDGKTHTVLSPTRPMPSQHPLEMQYAINSNCDSYREMLYAERSNYHASCIDWQTDIILGDRSIMTSLAVRWHKIYDSLSPLAYYQAVRQKESVIKIPDVVIQLDCDEKTLLDRYANRQRDYGLHEECIESVLLLKTNYQGVKNWLQTCEAESVIGKRVNWITIDTYGHGYLAILEQILEIIAKSS